MYALNEHNGTLIRQYQLPYFQLETGSYIPDFTVVNGVIYFSSPTMAFALSATNGSVLWHYSWSGRGASAPVVVNNVVYYVTGVGIIHAFNIRNGVLLWKHDLGPGAVVPGSIMGTYPTPVVTNNTMYIVGWLTDNVYALNLRDQTLLWHTHVNNEPTEKLYAANGALYVNTSAYSQNNAIHVLRMDNGTQLWSKNNFSLQLIDNDIVYSLAVDSNGSISNDLYALRSSDGTTVWHIQIGSSSYIGKVAVSHMTVYVITDTMLYAFHANDRSVPWQAPISGYMVGPTLSSTSSPTTTPTSISVSTPTPILVATPTRMPGQTLLYSADWSNGFNGWNGSSEWNAANGELRSDGREHAHPDSILSPFHPTTANYAVEARIQVVSLTDSCYVGIQGRAEYDSRYQGYFGGYSSRDTAEIDLITSISPNSAFYNLKNQPYALDLAWHIYRVEFTGNQITLKIDGNLLIQAIDNNSSGAGLVGLANGGCPINVSSFQVFAL